MTVQRKNKAFAFLLCFLSAFLFLAFETECSFLYRTQSWVDDNLFLTVGRSLLDGKVLYVDVFDHKGLYLYLVYGAMNALLPHAGNPFLGIFLLEVVAGTAFLYLAYLIAGLFTEEEWMKGLAAVLTGVCTYGAAFLDRGASAEEFILPFLAYGIYTFLKAWREEKMPLPVFFVNGLMAGVVLWWKFTMLGFWIGWCAILGILCWKRQGFLQAFYRMLLVLAGMALASLPALLYFWINGALDELFRIYFQMNLTGYSKDMGWREKIETWVQIAAWNFAPLFLTFSALALLTRRIPKEGRGMFGLFAFTAFFIYFGAVTHRYYFVPLAAFYPVAITEYLILARKLVGKRKEEALFKKPQVFDRVTAIFLVLFTLGFSAYFAVDTADARKASKQLSSAEQIAQIIKEENASLLCYYSYDWGVYALSDTLPVNNHFCIVNVEYYKFPELLREQWEMVENQVPDYLLMCNYQYPDEGGMEVVEGRYELVFSSDQGGIPLELWKRIE